MLTRHLRSVVRDKTALDFPRSAPKLYNSGKETKGVSILELGGKMFMSNRKTRRRQKMEGGAENRPKEVGRTQRLNRNIP